MRRIREKKAVDKSADKKKRDALIHSIAIEEQALTLFGEQKNRAKKEISEIEKEKETAREQADFYKNSAARYENEYNDVVLKLIPLQSEIGSLESRLGKLIKEEVAIRMSLREMQEGYGKERARLDSERIKEEKGYEKRKAELEQEIISLEAKIKVLTKSSEEVAKDVADKSREKVSLDSSLGRRMEELAQINLNLAQSRTESERAEKELAEVGNRIKSLKNDIAAKDVEISKKNDEVTAREQEVEKKREELVALMQRSKKIDEKAQAVKDLFQMAGLNVDI